MIKLRAGETDVDLLFAPLACAALPATLDIMDDAVLEGLDEASVRSLNGARLCQKQNIHDTFNMVDGERI